MKPAMALLFVAIGALSSPAPADAQRRPNRLTALEAERAELLAEGAPETQIATVETRIKALRLRTSAGPWARIGVRTEPAGPPFGHAYGYGAHGPGGRFSINTAVGGPPLGKHGFGGPGHARFK